jgi:hypothetical protein
MNRSVKNKPRSVAARLSRIAVESGITYEQILLRYGQERLLWRMVHSAEFDGFILKGAALFLAWQGRSYRTTRDVCIMALCAKGTIKPIPSNADIKKGGLC